MTDEIHKYLGAYKKLGPNSYEIGELSIRVREQPQTVHEIGKVVFGGSQVEFGSGQTAWGLNDGPHRGLGGASNIRNIATPHVMDEFMNEQIHNQKAIDLEYSARFNTLPADTEREWEAGKQAAKGHHALTPVESLAIEQKVTLDLIASKKTRYAAIAPAIYGLYGLSPYFLMNVLPRQKMSEYLNSGNFNNETLFNLWQLFDAVSKSAMELKAVSLSTAVLAGKLAAQAQKIDQAQSAENNPTPYQRLETIVQERDIHAQQLPENLYSEFITASGSMDNMLPAQALGHYKATLERMAASKIAAVNPVYGPPSFSSGGVTVHFPVENPNIKAPLSKPELEALYELVYLQANTAIGTKWQSYHDALLKVESARHLTATANALGALAERAKQAEQMIEAKRLADEQARVAAEAQRVAAEAAEQARLAAEAEAKRVADEQARLAAEAQAQRLAAEAAEQARLAAEAEAKSVADEQARLAAEAQAQRLAAEAAEQARLAAVAEAKRVADEQARLAVEAEAQRLAAEAAEQVRLAADAEIKRVADEQARAAEAIRKANTFSAHGIVSAASSLFMTSAGSIALGDAAAVALQIAIRAAALGAGAIAAAATAKVFIVLSAALYSSKLANGELPERYAFSTPLSDLAPEYGQDLWAIAASGGSVDLPVRISSKTAADGQSEIFVAKTDGRIVPSNVKVVAATYNADLNVYSVTTEDVPPRTLMWTPIVNPGNSSTASPAGPTTPPVYTGVTVTPLEGRIDTFPGLAEAGFDDFITVFPADSGLPPLYVMFSSPYGETNAKGQYSGRDYNTDKAGGPILDLEWRTTTVDLAGVDKVKLHIGRYGESADNKIMIERLERILKGELQVTDTDKRFYTHELRELERYRNLGVEDGKIPKNKSEVWNNAHTASLEDYKVNERNEPLYTPDAEDAYYKEQGANND